MRPAIRLIRRTRALRADADHCRLKSAGGLLAALSQEEGGQGAAPRWENQENAALRPDTGGRRSSTLRLEVDPTQILLPGRKPPH